jgi:hypothetical protein
MFPFPSINNSAKMIPPKWGGQNCRDRHLPAGKKRISALFPFPQCALFPQPIFCIFYFQKLALQRVFETEGVSFKVDDRAEAGASSRQKLFTIFCFSR